MKGATMLTLISTALLAASRVDGDGGADENEPRGRGVSRDHQGLRPSSSSRYADARAGCPETS